MLSSSSNNINLNNISASGTSESNIGIYLGISSLNNISSNIISTNGTSTNRGILLFSSSSNNIISNTFSTYGGINSFVFYLRNSSSDNNLINNTILNFTGYQLYFASASINGTYLIDQIISNYSFNESIVYFKNSQYGEIKFLTAINGSGNDLTNDVRILNNSVNVRSNVNSGLNRSANITLYGIGNRFSNPILLRDGKPCPVGICKNFTSLNAPEVRFNVSYWTNYRIGESDLIFPSINFTYPTPSNGSTVGGYFAVNISSNDTNQHYTILEMNKDLALWLRMDDVNGSSDPVDISSYSKGVYFIRLNVSGQSSMNRIVKF